nr:hypothetical protein CFP56_05107 [Quercus suber]
MNSNYKSEELFSLNESSSDTAQGKDGSDDDHFVADNVDHSVRRRKFPVFKPVAKAEHIRDWSKPLLTIGHSMSTGSVVGINKLRKNHPSVLIRDLFWKVAKTTYKQEFERAMNELKEVDEDAYNWLNAHSTTTWAGHLFSGDGQSDTVLNNMCESFNSKILKFRSKPIINILKCIRFYLMRRFQANREKILKVESELCPKIRKRLNKEKVASSRWLACWAGHTKFEVKNMLESFTMDLAESKCSCRKWDITTYYEPPINPIHGQNMWRPSGLSPVQPPIKRRPLGKPKKKRAKEPNEPRSGRKGRRVGISKQCKSCDKLGHNRRSCKGEGCQLSTTALPPISPHRSISLDLFSSGLPIVDTELNSMVCDYEVRANVEELKCTKGAEQGIWERGAQIMKNGV